ncbi:hypothetical protein Barb6XT_00588 [Bacteroidales bacterium Barb6XT]|nr:hypothetical protein Barb6XT_00588 [Bacteroidales bacterium Barb6XT]
MVKRVFDRKVHFLPVVGIDAGEPQGFDAVFVFSPFGFVVIRRGSFEGGGFRFPVAQFHVKETLRWIAVHSRVEETLNVMGGKACKRGGVCLLEGSVAAQVKYHARCAGEDAGGEFLYMPAKPDDRRFTVGGDKLRTCEGTCANGVKRQHPAGIHDQRLPCESVFRYNKLARFALGCAGCVGKCRDVDTLANPCCIGERAGFYMGDSRGQYDLIHFVQLGKTFRQGFSVFFYLKHGVLVHRDGDLAVCVYFGILLCSDSNHNLLAACVLLAQSLNSYDQ